MPGTPTCIRTLRKPCATQAFRRFDATRDIAPEHASTFGSLAAFSADELVDGHVGLPALDVPERLIDAADGVVQRRTVAPV